MNEKEFELKMKRYLFFKHVDKDLYEKRYSKIESMILEEVQKLNLDSDVSVAFMHDFINGEDEKLGHGIVAAKYNHDKKLFAFFPKNIDLLWEVNKEELAQTKAFPGCDTLRKLIKNNVLHEYRHYQQCKFVESMGIDSDKMGKAFLKLPYNENPMEIDARNYSFGNASDADLLKLVEAYYKLK